MQGSRFHSPVGEIRMLASDRGLAAIYFPVQSGSIEPRLAPGGPRRGLGNVFLLQAEAFLACYFDGDLDYSPDIPLDRSGSRFQMDVWNAIDGVPPGVRESYGDVAARMGRPGAARAVAGALARNPLAILVPCHRIVGADGRLTGYAGGLPMKRLLLDHEDRHADAVREESA